MENKSRIPFDFDSEKAALVKKTNALENNLTIELENVKEYLQDYGKNIVVIGGSLLATYLLLRLITRSEEKNNKIQSLNYPSIQHSQPVVHVVKESKDNLLVKQIKNSIALFLMSIAKKKLTQFLDQKLAKSE